MTKKTLLTCMWIGTGTGTHENCNFVYLTQILLMSLLFSGIHHTQLAHSVCNYCYETPPTT